MINEARALFKLERSRLSVPERADAVLSFLEHVETQTLLTEEHRAWINIDLQIYLGQSLYEQREAEKGKLEFQKAQDLLNHWCSLSNHQSLENLTPYLEIKLIQLKLLAHEDPIVYFNESVQLLELMKACCHASTTVCYGHAVDAADTLNRKGLSDPYREHFFQLHRERATYQETIQENIKSLVFDQRRLLMNALSEVRDIVKALEWIDYFMEKYGDFNLPGELESIHRWRKNAWIRLGDSIKASQEDNKSENFRSGAPVAYGALVGVRQSGTIPSNPPLDKVDPKFELAFPLDVDEDNFYLGWVTIAGDHNARRIKAMQLTLQWIAEDVKNGVIQMEEVYVVLGLPGDSAAKESLVEKIEALSPESAFARLYFMGTESAALVVDVDIWETRFSCLKKWLSRPSSSTSNGRQYLIVILQEIRKDSVASSTEPLCVQVLEIERLFSLLDDLLPRVKEIVVLCIPMWHGDILKQCKKFCDKSQNFDSDEVGAALEKAIYEGQQSIKSYQEIGGIISVAMMRRRTAVVCLWRIHWLLRRPGKTMSDPDLSELQETSLQYLEEAESVFSLRNQESTWSSNLEGLEARERANTFDNSWKVSRIAIQLLNAGDVAPDEGRTMQMWTWVQRFKARSLAMTMGVSGIVPPVLLREIFASEKCRSMYEKMISLQNQIEKAETQEKFWLRRELDSHISEMRHEELLKEVCDLRDGRPLNVRDIDRISAIVSMPLVLVDWFYVPGVMEDNGTLLLLTAKSGSCPTVTPLETTLAKVANWIDFSLDSPYAQEKEARGQGEKSTYGLSALVQPLIQLTQPGDTLIFCPTTKLYRIPLHAIEIEDGDDVKPLIHRNPIVYSHSHSLLRMCVWNSQLAAEVSSELDPLIMNGISPTQGNRDYATGRESVKKLASMLNAMVRLDDNATKAKFIESAPASRLIHVHSHVQWNAADPLKHNIDFFNSEAANGDGKLTAQEIFSISLSKGSHVSLIACSGGLTGVKDGDAVMGLVPALLHSGASSTVSTLWKIPDTAGARFTEAFYQSFLEERKRLPASGGFLNLARIFQEAVRGLNDEEKDPMGHWISFVLHGFWLFFVPCTRDQIVTHSMPDNISKAHPSSVSKPFQS